MLAVKELKVSQFAPTKGFVLESVINIDHLKCKSAAKGKRFSICFGSNNQVKQIVTFLNSVFAARIQKNRFVNSVSCIKADEETDGLLLVIKEVCDE